MTAAPSWAQVRAQVLSVRQKYGQARVIAIRLPALDALEAPPTLRIGSLELPVFRSDSVLALRERLVDLPAAGAPLVVLTNLADAELGADVVARFARRTVFSIDPWLLLKQRFRALHVDPRLVERHPWAARALLDAEPEQGYAPVPSGFLDAETAWRRLFETVAGVPRGERDPEALLAWALGDGPAAARLNQRPADVRKGLAEAAEASAGRAARVIFECAGRHGRRAVSAGLVARVLFDAGPADGERAAKARGKLEGLLALRELDAALARTWADAAEHVLRRRLSRAPDAGEAAARGAVDAALADADELLRELDAAELGWRSRVLRAGLDQRLGRLARELDAFVAGDAQEVPRALREAAGSVLGHALVAHDGQRRTGVEMALRLAGWLAARRRVGVAGDRSFAGAVRAYRAGGGFVDRARARLWEGDPAPLLKPAYAALARKADAARHEQNRAFGGLLAAWPGAAAQDGHLLGVEAVLDRRAVPVARVRPLLVLVIDALSMPLFRELEDDLAERGWVERASERTAAIAALPTVTEASRTSLLCGALGSGNAATEKEGFAAHAGLRAACAAAAPPVLFHKGDLHEAGAAGLAPKVVEALADPDRRVVGVVINAVDDHLARGDQMRAAWTARHIRPLEELLDVCRAGGRAVLVASDHGHVLERDSELRDAEGAERWRPASGAPREDEVLLQGPRVLAAGGRLLAPWSERVRFGMKKNGYHGGAALQEVVLPLGVFVPREAPDAPAGWREVEPERPGWWQWQVETGAEREPGPLASPADSPAAAPGPPRRGETGDLFAGVEAGAARPAATWIDRLFESDLFAAQRRQAARTALPEARIRTILAELDARGGKLTAAALAARLGVPRFRLGGIVSALRRLLNVEGYDVLSVDEASETVELNRALLDRQFGLAAGGEQAAGTGP